jgi:Rrf2 family iron-sulfur cluster assembly transcriptional regulator
MQISSKGKYSVRAVLDIAQHSHGEPVALAAISQREGISLLFLEQLFQQLRKGDIVKSVRGPHGGFVLARDPSEITIGDIIRVIEPPLYTTSCFDKGEAVESCRIVDSCIGHVLWRQLAEHIDNFLDSVTIADLCHARPEVVYGLKMKSHRLSANRSATEEVPAVEQKTADVA